MDLQETYELKFSSLTKKFSLAKDYDDIADVAEELDKYNSDKTQSANLFVALVCSFDTILLTPLEQGNGFKKANSFATIVMDDIRKRSDNINAMEILDEMVDLEGSFLVTMPESQNQPGTFHSFFVGIHVTNVLRTKYPNFGYTYGNVKVLDTGSKGVIPKTNYKWNSNLYNLVENVQGTSLAELVKRCSFEEYLSWFVQIIIALQNAVEEFNFTHYNLHAKNVIIRNVEGWLEYKTNDDFIYIKTKGIPVIINFDYSYTEIDGEKFGILHKEEDGILQRSRPWYDIYMLLTSSLYEMYNAKNHDCYRQAINIYRMLIDPNGVMETIILTKQLRTERKGGFIYSTVVTPGEDKNTLWQLLQDIKFTFRETWGQFCSDIKPRSKLLTAIELQPFGSDEDVMEDMNISQFSSFEEIVNIMKTQEDSEKMQEAYASCRYFHKKFLIELQYKKTHLEERLQSLNGKSIFKIDSTMNRKQMRRFIQGDLEEYVNLKEEIEIYMQNIKLLETYGIIINDEQDYSKFNLSDNFKMWGKRYKIMKDSFRKTFVKKNDEKVKQEVFKIIE